MQRISVLIPTLNNRERIGGVIAAVDAGKTLLAERDTAVEIIVIDGGSYDDTVARAESAGARCVAVDGNAAARWRAGLAEARGEWLLLLPPELTLPGDWAEAAARAIADRDGQRAAHYFTWRVEDGTGFGPSIIERLVDWTNRRFAALREDQAVLLHRSLINTVGALEPDTAWPLFDLGRELGSVRLKPVGAATLATADPSWRDGFVWRGAKTGWPLLLRLIGLRGAPARWLGGGAKDDVVIVKSLRERARKRENKKQSFFSLALARAALRVIAIVFALVLLYRVVAAEETRSWDEISSAAAGQTVYWNVWAGNQAVNGFVDWAIEQVEARHPIEVERVKVADVAEAVSRVLAEKAAGRDQGGSVDLIWINGENFASMKENGLLYGPFTAAIPNHRLLDVDHRPELQTDFTIPVDGMEAAWGLSQFNLLFDSAVIETPPDNAAALLAWIAANPGRFSYPRPPDFIGSTFLKQILLTTAVDSAPFYRPVSEENFAAATAGLWSWLEQAHPHLWRSGRRFPRSGAHLQQLLGDGEVDIALAFNAAAAANLIADGTVPESVRPHVFSKGMIGNAHFLAIPYNASAKEAAMLVINFLLSPEAQARKMDIRHWGDLSVLSPSMLNPDQLALFDALPDSPARLDPARAIPLAEPHPSWMLAIEREWERRYGR